MVGEFSLEAVGSQFSAVLNAAGPLFWLGILLFIVLIGIAFLVFMHLKGYAPWVKYPNDLIVLKIMGGNSLQYNIDRVRKIVNNDGYEDYEQKSNKAKMQKLSYANMIPRAGSGRSGLFVFKPSDEETYPVNFDFGEEEYTVEVPEEYVEETVNADGSITRTTKTRMIPQVKKRKRVSIIPLLSGSDRNAYIDRLRRNEERLRKKSSFWEKNAWIIGMLIFGAFVVVTLGAWLWRADVIATSTQNMATAMQSTNEMMSKLIQLQAMSHNGTSLVGG